MRHSVNGARPPTYDPAAAAGWTSAYPHLDQHVFSRTLGEVDDATVTVVADSDPLDYVCELKQQGGLGIWLCGGAQLAGQLLPEIDELIPKVNPGRGRVRNSAVRRRLRPARLHPH